MAEALHVVEALIDVAKEFSMDLAPETPSHRSSPPLASLPVASHPHCAVCPTRRRFLRTCAALLLLSLLALLSAHPPARAQRSAILTDLGGGETPATAIVGGPDILYAAHGPAIWRYALAPGHAPVRTGTAPVTVVAAAVERMVLRGERLVVADAVGGIGVFDIHDRDRPVVWGRTVVGTGSASEVILDGDRVIVIDWVGVLHVLAITAGQPPRELGTLQASLRLDYAALDGTWLYALGVKHQTQLYGPWGVHLLVLDLKDPTRPREVANLGIAGVSGYGSIYPRGIAVKDHATVIAFADMHADSIGPFMAPWMGLYLAADVRDAGHPKLLAADTSSAEKILPASGWNDVERIQDLPGALIWTSERGLQHIDVRDPLKPVFSREQPLFEEGAVDLTHAGDQVVALDRSGLMYAVEFADPSAMRLAGTTLTSRHAVDVVAAGQLAYVANDRAGLAVLDVSDPTRRRQVGWLDLAGMRLERLTVAGNLAFLAAGETGVVVVDVTDPAAPREVAVVDTPGRAVSVKVAGGFAYVADESGGVAILDVGVPAAARLVGSVPTEGEVHDVAVAGHRLFVALAEKGLLEVDVTDPMRPGSPATIEPYLGGQRLAVADGRLVAIGDDGLLILDLRDVSEPLFHGATYDLGCYCGGFTSITIEEGFAYTTWTRWSSESGVTIFDLRAPDHPKIAAELPSSGIPSGLARAGEHLLVADGFMGLHLFRAVVAPRVRVAYLPSVLSRAVDSPLRQVTSPVRDRTEFGFVQPAVAPDGRRLVAMQSFEGQSGYVLWLVDLADRSQHAMPIYTEVLPITGAETPTFTPSGRFIVFAGQAYDGQSQRWDVYVYDLVTDGIGNVTAGLFGPASQQRRPALSPDGRWLAFDRADSPGADGKANAEDIYLMDLQTRDVRQLTHDAAVDRFPSFSPDGRRILFRSQRDGQSEIYEVGVDGNGLRRMTSDPGFDGYPSYGPGGRWIVFQSNRRGKDEPFLLDPTSLIARPVADGTRVLREPRFMPDGLRLVVSSPDEVTSFPFREASHVYELTLPLWTR